MYVIILGAGRLGSELALLLSTEEHDVVVVDREDVSFERLGASFDGEIVQGVGIDIDVLKRAGIERADAFAAVSSDDNTNIMAAQIAKEIFSVPRVIARIFDPEREEIYHHFGLETICPTRMGAIEVKNYILSDNIVTISDISDSDLQFVEIAVTPFMIGKKISQLNIPGKFMINAIARDDSKFIPEPDAVIEPGDIVYGMLDVKSIVFQQNFLGKAVIKY